MWLVRGTLTGCSTWVVRGQNARSGFTVSRTWRRLSSVLEWASTTKCCTRTKLQYVSSTANHITMPLHYIFLCGSGISCYRYLLHLLGLCSYMRGLYAMMLSVCLSVCLSVIIIIIIINIFVKRHRQSYRGAETRTQNAFFFTKSKQFRAIVYWRPIGSPTRTFQGTHSLTLRWPSS